MPVAKEVVARRSATGRAMPPPMARAAAILMKKRSSSLNCHPVFGAVSMASLSDPLPSEAQFPDKGTYAICNLVVARAHFETVSLRGASELTSSFLKCAINGILYHRQIFPKQSFACAQRFGCEVRVTKDEWLEKYLTNFFGQVLTFYMRCGRS